MKKLAIGVLLVLSAAACRRQAVVTTAPTQQPPRTPAASTAPGGATANEALARFLAAVKVQDVQALSNVWGTKTGGPASTDRRYMTVEQMEQRLIYTIRCTRHDSWRVTGETPVVGGDRQFMVELRKGTLTAVTDFTATLGPANRWYIVSVDLEKTKSICAAS